MLNRTNRTLSANLNRLNLGTRSLAATANVNFGDLQTLRTRHAHRVVMRDGMLNLRPSPIHIVDGSIPSIPGSPIPVSSWPVVGQVRGSRVELAVETSVVGVNSPCWLRQSQSSTSEQSLPRQERSKLDRKPFAGKRLYTGGGTGRTSTRAALATVAALHAAAGG